MYKKLINSINFDGTEPKNTSTDRFNLMSQRRETAEAVGGGDKVGGIKSFSMSKT